MSEVSVEKFAIHLVSSKIMYTMSFMLEINLSLSSLVFHCDIYSIFERIPPQLAMNWAITAEKMKHLFCLWLQTDSLKKDLETASTELKLLREEHSKVVECSTQWAMKNQDLSLKVEELQV